MLAFRHPLQLTKSHENPIFFLKKISNNIEIIVKNISKGYNKSVKTVPIFYQTA